MDRIDLLRRRQLGITMMELMVALLASAIVIIALGKVVIVNQQATTRSRDRAEMQGHTTVVMSRISRAVRGANRIERTGPNAFRLYDLTGGVTHTYRLVNGSDGPRLQQNSTDMADLDCTRFDVTINADTTSVTVDLEFSSADSVKYSELNTVSIRNRTLEY